MQEQIKNIIKYANAKKIEIQLKTRQGLIFMQIADDGNGFDAPCKKSRHSIEEYAETN